jgi:cyclophilin family peptidyl-prolyl cis-trans isomerase
MKKQILFIAVMLIQLAAFGQKKPVHRYIEITTQEGVGVIQLYNETPQHRDNFVKLVQENFYDGILFHRVIQHFMIQGGDPSSKYATPTQRLGSGGPTYKIPAEINESRFHKKGALGAARDNNPEKASSASQFYLVQGRTFTDGGLDSLQTFRMKGRQIPAAQREVYKTLGGTPHLDQDYTVFGELISGLELVDKIAAVKTDASDRPVDNQAMQMRLLDRREAINLERQMEGKKPQNGLFTKLFDLFKPTYK